MWSDSPKYIVVNLGAFCLFVFFLASNFSLRFILLSSAILSLRQQGLLEQLQRQAQPQQLRHIQQHTRSREQVLLPLEPQQQELPQQRELQQQELQLILREQLPLAPQLVPQLVPQEQLVLPQQRVQILQGLLQQVPLQGPPRLPELQKQGPQQGQQAPPLGLLGQLVVRQQGLPQMQVLRH